MANTLLNEFVARGTAADRAAFVPDEPANTLGGPTHGYLWWETDTERLWAWNGSAWERVVAAAQVRTIQFVIGDGVNVITTGFKDFTPPVPFAGTITKATVLSIDAATPTSGSIVVDIWKDSYANYPPASGDSIVASAPPTLSSDTKSQDSTLSGWTTSVSVGDIFGASVSSASGVKKVLISLEVTT